SYLNLRSVNLTYNVPKDFSKKLNVGNAKLYATAENLFLISKRKGMNIQQSFAGTTSNAYIQSRIVTVGLNVSF
ncbi:MAG: hypothetical protein Q7V19_18195, partial [Bacteroidales bacterium]|nr:hypothetical protein [Bacteroidales bacterium]